MPSLQVPDDGRDELRVAGRRQVMEAERLDTEHDAVDGRHGGLAASDRNLIRSPARTSMLASAKRLVPMTTFTAEPNTYQQRLGGGVTSLDFEIDRDGIFERV